MRMKDSVSEENLSRKENGVIPGEVTSPWPKAGRQKGQQAQDMRSAGPEQTGVWWGWRETKSERWAWAGLP